MWGIMATNEKDQTDATQQSLAPATPVSQAAPTKPTASNLQNFFVSDYNVSVEAASMSEAIEKVKELKGVK